MILGLGLDVCEIARVRGKIERLGDRFVDELLAADERAHCERQGDMAVCLAGRFAAKEAAIKALGGAEGLRWHDLRIIPAEGEPPRLELGGAAGEAAGRMGVQRVHLTVTHDAGVAAAVVILEGAS